MLIKLKYFYDIPEGELLFDKSIIQFSEDYFTQSIHSLKTFFASEDIDVNNIEIKVFCQNEFNTVDDHNDAIRCMMADIKNEDSCTYKLLEPLLDHSDMIEKKVAMIRYLLENYFICIGLYNSRSNDRNFVECYHDYLGPYNFKYILPKNIISKYTRYYQEFGANGIELSKLSAEELVMYVIPRYYQEIGWWDNESLRKDTDKMAKLSISWME